jgi:hypothetical protein
MTYDLSVEILKKDNITVQDRIVLEALTARYSRTLNFFINKLLSLVDALELENEGSVLDRINRFKKRGVLDDETDWRIFKDLENKIAHEYIVEETDDIVTDVIKYGSILMQSYDSLKIYCKKFGI